ncbi:MAG: DUF6531 domain-containing protein, partial [Candidatus Zixiibacteriota bacterium]
MRNFALYLIIAVVIGMMTSTEGLCQECYGGIECDSTCMPIVVDYSAEVIGVDPSTGLVAFCFSISARGQKEFPFGGFVAVLNATDGYGEVVSCHVLELGCHECTGKFSRLLQCPDGQIGFWWEAWQYLNNGYCGCTSDTTWISVPEISPEPTDVPLAKEDEYGKPLCTEAIGHPINALNGNVYTEAVDVTIPSDRGPSLRFVRHYNSMDAFTTALGRGWRHSYDYSIWISSDSSRVNVREGSGRQLSFRNKPAMGDYWYESPLGVLDRLEFEQTAGVYYLVKPDDTKYWFDTERQLDYIEDRNGNRLDLNYEGGFLTSVTDASGRSLNFVYAGTKLSEIRSDLDELLVSYDYDDEDWVLERATYPDGSWEGYTYAGDIGDGGYIHAISNSAGVGHYYGYDPDGRATSTYGNDDIDRADLTYIRFCDTCPVLFETNVSYPNRNKSSVFHSMFSNDGDRRILVDVTDPDCPSCAVAYEYDGGGNRRRIIYANGVEDTLSYDVRGNMLSYTRAANTSLAQTTFFEYHDVYNLPTKEYSTSIANPASGDTIRYDYDDNGNLQYYTEFGWKSATESYEYITSYSYNEFGQVETINGPRTDVSDIFEFDYYSNGDLRYVVKANGDTTEYGLRDEMGNRTWVKDANGMIKRYEYDGRNRPSKVILASETDDSTITTFDRNYNGDIDLITFPEGNTIDYEYDNHNWLTSVTNSAGDQLVYGYDTNSDLTHMEIKNNLDVVRKYENYFYNEDGLLERITNPDLTYTEYEYDEMGNRLSVRDANGHYTYYVYDELNRLDSAIQMDGLDSLITQFFYDADNNLTTLIDAEGNTFSFVYDDRGLLLEENSSVTGLTKYTYDAAGNCVSKLNAKNETTVYHYDALNRLTLVEYADPSQNVSYVYDQPEYFGKGRLCWEINSICSLGYRYDLLGRLDQELMNIDNLEYITSYDYDMNGDISVLTHHVGHQVIYNRDAARRVSEVRWVFGDINQVLATQIQYEPFGGPTSWYFGNGISGTINYDVRYLAHDILTSNPAVLNRTYAHDAVGNITGITDNLDNSRSRTFGYDDLDQLTSAASQSYPGGSIGFTYHGNGNRETKTVGINTTTYEYTNNRLTGLTGTETASFGYDALGNLTSSNLGGLPRTYQWDYSGRLLSIDEGAVAEYEYDSRSRR